MKRVFSLILCLALMLSLAVSASAAEITISGGASGAEYSAYRLLDLTLNSDGSSFGYTVNSKYETVLKQYFSIPADASNAEISNIVNARLATLTTNSDELYAFAESIYEEIKSMDADAVSANDKFTGVEQGYYLIAETKLGNDPADTRSLIMLNTLGKDNLTIATKESAPEINKQVYVNNDSSNMSGDTWREYADYDIGDEIPFQIIGSVSGRYEHYENYIYKFDDTMSEGLNMKTDGNGNIVDMTITIGNLDITDYFDIKLKENKLGFTAEADLKVVEATIKKTDPSFAINHNTRILVSYKAILTDAAVSSSTGNTNKVTLEYSNDPYSNSTGTTPEDTNVVFTYTGILNKVMEDGETPLAGAEFKLEKWDKNINAWKDIYTIGADETTTFEFEGLDVGIYRLSETKAPAGYSPIVPFEFQIVATYNTDADPVVRTGLAIKDRDGDDLSTALNMEVSINNNNGTFESDIVNKTGTALPTTGGMGTTLIYTVGGILVLAAIILLVTKKRMTSAE